MLEYVYTKTDPSHLDFRIPVSVDGNSLVVGAGTVVSSGKPFLFAGDVVPIEIGEARVFIVGLLVSDSEDNVFLMTDEVSEGKTPYYPAKDDPYSLLHVLFSARIDAGAASLGDCYIRVYNTKEGQLHVEGQRPSWLREAPEE